MKRDSIDRITGIEKKVLQYIRSQNLLKPGERVLAGVSGGADSICLLFVLLKVKEIFREQLVIHVIHIHHGIRGQEADQDMQYVERLCEKYQIPYHGVYCPVLQIAEEQGMSVEEAGRMVRYQEFERVRKEQGLDKVAVAHHRDDNVETILMNLFRGSGLKGLSGIPSVRESIIRPLLEISRAEIEHYLYARGITYQMDSTNQSCDYTRNRIRNELLPYLETYINKRAAEHILRLSAYAGQLNDYFQEKADELFEKYGTIEENRVILCLDCLLAPDLEINDLIRQCIAILNNGLKDIGQVHIRQVRELMQGRTGTKLWLPGKILVEKNYKDCIFTKIDRKDLQKKDEEHWIPLNIDLNEKGTPFIFHFFHQKFIFTVKNVKKDQTFPKKTYTKWFDYDKIKFTLQLRTRKSGDTIVINAAGGTKKLKDYFIDAKIPRKERDCTLLLADGSDIVWIIGKRMSEKYKVGKDTKTILEVTYEEKCLSME